ncbi:MAG: hypothetical protein KF791_20430 [Verrucomicrobiae bacterium]|nr:hypothetical protein [Verrucomicrobiae bacterium]
MPKTKKEFLQEITESYRIAGEKWPASAKDIAAWAILEGLWQPYPKSLISQCAQEIASAMRDEHYTDPQGRSVRKLRPFREDAQLLNGECEQTFLWVDMQDATPKQALKALQYGRQLAVHDCRQLKSGVDSYNENNPHGAYIEMSFDFREDMEELEAPAHYPGIAS